MKDLEIQEQAENPAKFFLKQKGIHPTEPIYWDLATTTISIDDLLDEYVKWMQEQDDWISVEILPVAGTECYFIVQFTNEFGLQNIQHTGIFGALGFTSYHDSENYSIKEVTKHFPLPSPPKTK